MFAEAVPYPAAFLAGLLSFFSPCILPLIPVYFTFISGTSVEGLNQSAISKPHKRVIIATLLYILGFSAVFIILGASASYLGVALQKHRDVIRVIGGVLVVIFGLHMIGILRLRWLDFEKRIHLHQRPAHFGGAFIVGMAFGAGWSPCIGPLLGSILILAGNQETVQEGILLLSVFSFGLALPFLVLALCINYLLVFIKKASRGLKPLNVTAGVLLIVVGLFLITDKLYLFSAFG